MFHPFARNLKRRVGGSLRFAATVMPTGYVRAIRSRAQPTAQCSAAQPTAQPTAQRGGMLRAFFSDQAAAMSSGKQHHKAGIPPPPVLQRVLMACSSLLYLCCSYAWSRFGYRWLGLWFCLVSALSVVADAGRLSWARLKDAAQPLLEGNESVREHTPTLLARLLQIRLRGAAAVEHARPRGCRRRRRPCRRHV